jgi:hypothetical protein
MLPRGLAHHYAHNRHHPEHYPDGLEGMNLFDLLEMLVDWMAAVQRHDDGDIQKSLKINGDRFGMSPQLQKIFANTVEYFGGDEFQGISTQKDLTQAAKKDEASKKRQGMHDYLRELEYDPELRPGDVEVLFWAWRVLDDCLTSRKLQIDVPDACLGDRRNLMFAWHDGDNYLECEVFASSGRMEFFCKDWGTGRNDGVDVVLAEPETVVPEKVLDMLATFASPIAV